MGLCMKQINMKEGMESGNSSRVHTLQGLEVIPGTTCGPLHYPQHNQRQNIGQSIELSGLVTVSPGLTPKSFKHCLETLQTKLITIKEAKITKSWKELRRKKYLFDLLNKSKEQVQ